MAKKRAFALIYDTEVTEHVAEIDRKYHSLIRRTIEEQLHYEPQVETRNRKPLTRPTIFGTAWELRFGPDNRFRVFYRVDTEVGEVYILAVGVKLKDRLFIGKEEFKL
jgi:mRNA-degrading endonuclease RelE of RelBE toxin-antitoxin system